MNASQKVGWKNVRHHWELYLFVLPAVCMLGLFQYYPAMSGIYHSFFRWNGADISEFVGFGNYTELLGSAQFWQSFHVALLLGLFNVIKMLPAIAMAVWIHRCRSEKMQYFYRTLLVVPMVIPGLVVALIWRSFFFEASNGYLNSLLNATGLLDFLAWLDHLLGWGGVFVSGQNPAWLGDPRLTIAACILWGFPWIGSFAVLTYLAKLQNIPKEIYEAGEIDGTSWWSKFTQIEMPLLLDSLYLMLVFVIIGTIKDAGSIFVLVGIEGGPGGVATVPALFMLRKAFVSQQMGAACAIGIVLTIVVLLLQKLSVTALEWKSLRPQMQRLLRIAALVVGVAMIVSGFLIPLGMLLVCFGVQAGRLFGWVRDRMLRNFDPEKYKKPTRTLGRDSGWHLRLCKHAAIWTVLAFAFLPAYLMIVVSFKTNEQFYVAPVAIQAPFHYENWVNAWKLIMPSLANSLFIACCSTGLVIFLALAAAYFFGRTRMPMSGLLWNAILLLLMMPTIANLVPLFRLLSSLHLLNTLTALILVGASGGQVFAIFILRNFVQDIPHDLFEAAEIDGANHFKQMIHVVLPLCGPILATVGVMHFITEWNEFILPLIVIRDADQLPVMVQLLRLAGEYIKYWGPLMAGYTLASAPIVLLFVFSMRLFVKGMTEGAVKG